MTFSKLFKFALWVLFLLSGIFTLLSLGGSYFTPLDSLAHFRHYYLLALLVVAVLAMFSRQWRLFLVSLIGFAVGVSTLQSAAPFKGFAGPSITPRSTSELIITQYNLNYRNGNYDEIAHRLTQMTGEQPDIIMMQEISAKNTGILDLLKPLYPFQQVCPMNDVFNSVIVSKYLAVDQGCFDQSQLAWLKIELSEDQTIYAGSWHLHWPWPYGQKQQIEAFKREVKGWDKNIPKLIGGDFNAVPWSFAVNDIANSIDARPAPGLRITLQKFISPFKLPLLVPIDHLLVTDSWGIARSEKLGRMGSDHYAVQNILRYNSKI